MTTPIASSTPPRPDGTPSLVFAEPGLPADRVRAEVDELCAADHAYADGTVFNSICSSPLELAAEVFVDHLEANLGDNRIFPGLPEVEREVTAMLGELLGHPRAAGCATSGGTEANMLALLAALGEACRRGARARVLLPESAHYSFDKLAAILPVEFVRARLDAGYRVDVEDVRRKLTADTALVVVTAGTSECGAVDDVRAVGALAAEAGIALHVDAATGGFLIPFARELGHPVGAFDFALPGVSSITLDPHKYGYAPIPAGHLLFRDPASLEHLRFASHYRGTRDQSTLLGTRPGAGVLATYAALRHLGRSGYRRIVGRLLTARDELCARLQDDGFALAYVPDLTIVGIDLDRPEDALAYLERRGLIASVSRRHGFLRIVVQRHLEPRDYESLLDALSAYRREASTRSPSCG
jgi:tyrosine decarboxylase/aspartate 1-decarboxylase